MSELVTGDPVVLGLRPAKLPSSALALAIDLVVVGTAFGLVALGLAFAGGSWDDAAWAAMSVAAFLLVPVGGPIAVETLSHGRSLGKPACGLRVVRDDGGPIRFRHALVRGAMEVVEILLMFGVVAVVASLVSARGRRLGDLFAGTLVVRERVPAGRTAAVPPPPPWLVGRFAGLDLSTVPDELWLSVRPYLTRMHQLDAAVGRAMAERLGVEVAARTGAPPPSGLPAGGLPDRRGARAAGTERAQGVAGSPHRCRSGVDRAGASSPRTNGRRCRTPPCRYDRRGGGASTCHRVRAARLRVSGRRVGIPGLRARCRGRRAPRRRRGGSCAVRPCPGR